MCKSVQQGLRVILKGNWYNFDCSEINMGKVYNKCNCCETCYAQVLSQSLYNLSLLHTTHIPYQSFSFSCQKVMSALLRKLQRANYDVGGEEVSFW